MRVLVTGATGFVGRALVDRLLRDGLDVRAAVRARPQQGGVRAIPAVEVGDIGPNTRWRAALEGVAAIVHLAARVHVTHEGAVDSLAAFRSVNVAGTRRLADAAAQAGVRRFVLLSTAKVHGERSARPFTEDDPPQPEDAYARSKLEAERAVCEVCEGTGMGWVILRPPLVYGPGVRANFLRLMQAVARGVPLPLGAADAPRSLIYVENLADAIALGLAQSGAANRLYLASDGEDLSVAQLVRRLAALLGVKPRLVPVPKPLLRAAARLLNRRAQIERLIEPLQLDSARLRADLGWQVPFTVQEGLEATVRWFRGVGRA